MAKNKWILIGYPNQFYTKQLNLAALNVETEEHIWIFDEKLNELTKDVFGVVGITKIHNKFLIAYQSDPAIFIFLNQNFSYKSHYISKKIIDTHSISYHQGEILVSSTGNDSIYRLHLNEDFEIKYEEKIWTLNEKADRKLNNDLFHVNSICHFNNNKFISCFGHTPSVKNTKGILFGKIINIDNNEIINKNLIQPHTLTRVDNDLFYCESGTGLIHSMSGIKIKVGGYLRGLTYDDKFLYVGCSGQRIKSKSTKKVNTNSKEGEEDSKIVVLDRNDFKKIKTIELGTYGNEIYDLIFLGSFDKGKFSEQNKSLQITELKKTIFNQINNNKNNTQKTISDLLKKYRN